MSRKQSAMEEWQYLDYQQILYSLFEIVEGYDFSDEVSLSYYNLNKKNTANRT